MWEPRALILRHTVSRLVPNDDVRGGAQSREGVAQLRKGSAPQIMAGIMNLATGTLHAGGHTKIAPALR
jgi:hypothetical protein